MVVASMYSAETSIAVRKIGLVCLLYISSSSKLNGFYKLPKPYLFFFWPAKLLKETLLCPFSSVSFHQSLFGLCALAAYPRFYLSLF